MMQKTALITGGTGLIGKGLVELFARNSCTVVFTYSSSITKAQQIIDNLAKENLSVEAVKLDLTDDNSIKSVISYIKEKYGELDILINNAAILPGRMSLLEMAWEEVNKQINTNLTAVIKLSAGAVELMKNNGGSIINISSESAKFGGNLLSVYAASKAGLNTFIIGFAREIGKYNIRVNNISPAIIKDATEIVENTILNSIPLGRVGRPEDIANLAYFLTTDQAGYITGSTITISGGR